MDAVLKSNSRPIELRASWIRLVMFFGPIGALIPVPGMPHSFRFYYLLLLPGILVLARAGFSSRIWMQIRIVAPLVFYCAVSASAYNIFPGPLRPGWDSAGSEGNPLVRWGLLVALLLFTMLAADYAERSGVRYIMSLLKAALYGYLVSMAAGYGMFIGFYTGLLSEAQIAPFHVLLQFGYGLLRFSPGSYPNEYGIVSSFFLSVLTLSQWCGESSICHKLLGRLVWTRHIIWVLVFGAMFLATTRAAYVAFALSLMYIATAVLDIKRAAVFTASISAVLLAILLVVSRYYDVVEMMRVAYEALFDEDSSAYERIFALQEASAYFAASPILGTGFGSLDMMHNTYLQLVFGLGLTGSLLLALTLAGLSYIQNRRPSLCQREDQSDLHFLVAVRMIGLIHILWFAVGNHNLNHFLTWLAVLLVLGLPVQPKEARTLR